MKLSGIFQPPLPPVKPASDGHGQYLTSTGWACETAQWDDFLYDSGASQRRVLRMLKEGSGNRESPLPAAEAAGAVTAELSEISLLSTVEGSILCARTRPVC